MSERVEPPDEQGGTESKQQRTSRRGLGRIYSRPNSPNLWIEYWHLGRCHRESVGSPFEGVARRLLRKRQGEIARKGRVVGPEVERTRYEDLEQLLLEDIAANRSPAYLISARARVRHLRRAFRGMLAQDLDPVRLTRYKTARLKQAKPSVVRMELAFMRRAMRLAVIAGRLEHVPPFPPVAVDNAKTDFCTPEQIELVLQHLPEHVAPVVRLLYWTGMRKGEAVGIERKGDLAPARTGLEWSRVDFEASVIKLRPGDTKTRHARTIPLNARLRALLLRQRERVSAMERERQAVIPEVFPDCCPVTFKRWWLRAVRAAGLPWLTPHGMRRSFARNAIRSGVSEGVTMRLLGHRTRAMLDRYNVTSTEDLAAGMGRLDSYLSNRAGAPAETGPAHRPAHSEKAATSAASNALEKLELVTGIEPVTPSLRVTCSTS